MKAACLVWAHALHGAGCADVSRPDQPDTRERNVGLLGETAHNHLQDRMQALRLSHGGNDPLERVDVQASTLRISGCEQVALIPISNPYLVILYAISRRVAVLKQAKLRHRFQDEVHMVRPERHL